DEARAALTVVFPKPTGHPGGQCADAALQEDVGVGALAIASGSRLLGDLGGNAAVALHHIARDVLVALVSRVGNDPPAVRGCQTGRFLDRRVVVAGDAHDARAIGGDGLLTLAAHAGMQHDHAAAAGVARGGSQAAAVVAV